jgi:hypothetical protein
MLNFQCWMTDKEAIHPAHEALFQSKIPGRVCHPFVTRFSSSRPAAIVLNGS